MHISFVWRETDSFKRKMGVIVQKVTDRAINIVLLNSICSLYNMSSAENVDRKCMCLDLTVSSKKLKADLIFRSWMNF